MWAGTAVNELAATLSATGTDQATAVPLKALQSLITTARDTSDLATLDRLRDAWELAAKQTAET
jgi:hypothetical protein